MNSDRHVSDVLRSGSYEGRSGTRLEFRSVRREYEGTGPVIDGVSLQITSGEFIALLGPSGCGKSTLLRLAAGLDRPDGGEIVIDPSGSRFDRGFVFQDAHLLPWRSVLENVTLPLELIGRPKVVARQEALQALERVGLQEALDRFPGQLSGGMRMRVSVARALVTQPTLLLLDEPFAALDENTRHRLQEELRVLWEREPITVLFVTHSISEAVYLANRTVVLSPRPARVLLDRQTKLPHRRTADMRADPVFLDEVKQIRAAFIETDEERGV